MAVDPETSYILSCLESRLFPAQSWLAPTADLDWERFFALVMKNRLSGLFYALGCEQPLLYPDAIRERLRLEHYAWMLHGDRCAEKITTCLSALTAAGIPVIVLKGWAWIQTLYGGDHSLRFCEDIDLLVHPMQVDDAERILQEQEYIPDDEPWPGYTRRFMNCRAFLASLHISGSRAFGVGLHWGLLHSPAYDPDQIDVRALFEKAGPVRVAGVEVLELCIEDQIAYACAHLGLHHRYDPAFFRFYELAALVQRAGPLLNWDEVFTRAVNWQCVIPAQRILKHTHTLWQDVIPLTVIEEVNALKPSPRERLVDQWLQKYAHVRSMNILLDWLTQPGFWKCFQKAFQDIIPSPAYMRRRYSPAKKRSIHFLYVRRFLRLLDIIFHNCACDELIS